MKPIDEQIAEVNQRVMSLPTGSYYGRIIAVGYSPQCDVCAPDHDPEPFLKGLPLMAPLKMCARIETEEGERQECVGCRPELADPLRKLLSDPLAAMKGMQAV